MATIATGTQIFSGKSLRHVFGVWDPHWWQMAIAHGYPQVAISGSGKAAENTIAFFPLYPLLAHTIRIFGLTPLQAGIVISLLAGAIATVLLWILTTRLTNKDIANKAVALFCFFPGSLAMTLLMSEALMIALSIACLLALLSKRWVVAGLLAALATATRPNALVLVLCCAWAAGQAIVHRREWRALIAPILAPLGMLSYFAFLWHHTGDFLAWFHVEREGWKYDNYKPFDSLSALSHPFAYFDNTAAVFAFFTAALGLILLTRWKPPAVISIFAAGIVLLAFESGGTESKVRYVWTAFPLFIAAATWARNEIRLSSLISIASTSSVLYTLLTLFTLRIVL